MAGQARFIVEPAYSQNLADRDYHKTASQGRTRRARICEPWRIAEGHHCLQVQLHADIGSMVFDGSDADVQISRDLAAGLRVSDELKDAPLGGSKIVEPRLFCLRGLRKTRAG